MMAWAKIGSRGYERKISLTTNGRRIMRAVRGRRAPPPPLPRTNRTSLVPPLVLSEHAVFNECGHLLSGLRGWAGGGNTSTARARERRRFGTCASAERVACGAARRSRYARYRYVRALRA